jgi:hypothetical protein
MLRKKTTRNQRKQQKPANKTATSANAKHSTGTPAANITLNPTIKTSSNGIHAI